jgi:hypothetical protein
MGTSSDLLVVINGCHIKIQKILSLEGPNVKLVAMWRSLLPPIIHTVSSGMHTSSAVTNSKTRQTVKDKANTQEWTVTASY